MVWDVNSVYFKLRDMENIDFKKYEKKIDVLAKNLKSREHIIYGAVGKVTVIEERVNYKDAITICTNERILFVYDYTERINKEEISKSIFGKETKKIITEKNKTVKFKSIPINKIDSICREEEVIDSNLKIWYETNKIVFISVDDYNIVLLDYVITRLKNLYNDFFVEKNNSVNRLDILEKLKKLVDIEAITEEEYNSKKDEILKGL